MLEWSRVFVAKPRVVIIREDRTSISLELTVGIAKVEDVTKVGI